MRVRKCFMAAFLVILGVTSSAWGASFREVPPVAWAYTLRGGELLIGGGLSFVPGNFTGVSFELAYGVHPGVQLGARAQYSRGGLTLLGTLFEVKVRFSPDPNVNLAFPLNVALVDVGAGIMFQGLGSGAVLSWRIGELILHGELGLWWPRIGPFLFLGGGIDYDLSSAARLGAQARVFLPSLAPSFAVAAWPRPWPVLDVRLALHPLALTLEGTVHLRFRLF